MRRFLLFAGVTLFAFLTFAALSTSDAVSRDFLLQDGLIYESEPNNSFGQADEVPVPGQAVGQASNAITGTDYFSMTVDVGREYEAVLTINSPQGMPLRMSLYNAAEDRVERSTSSTTETTLSWTADDGLFYIQVIAVPLTSTLQSASYNLSIARLEQETATPTPTVSPTPSPTVPAFADEYEPNNGFDAAATLPVELPLGLALTFHTTTDQDWFRVWVKAGNWYEATTSGLSGVDTYLEVRTRDNDLVASNDDGGGGFASSSTWGAQYDGYYYVRVLNKVGTTGSYDLTLEETTAPAGPTPTPLPGFQPQADSCENNFNFDTACVIPADEYLDFNFVPPYPNMTDNDFFKLWIKPGLIYNCATSDLSPGIDPNMIVYDQNRNAIGGNDDVSLGNLNSSFAYYSTYEGWLYILVGTGDRTPTDLYDSDYTLRCAREVPGQPTSTPAPTQEGPDPTAQPTAIPSPTPTVTPPAAQLDVRTLATPAPPSTEEPSLHFIPVDLIVYYDANDDRSSGAGEGVAGVLVLAYDTATGEEIAQGFTDELGHLEFTAAAEGVVRLSIPYLGVSHLVGEGSGTVYVRIAPGAVP